MDPGTAKLLAVIGFWAVTFAGGLWLVWRRGAQRLRDLEAQFVAQSEVSRMQDDLDELRQHVALFGEQMEALTEGQDFLVRLINDRQPSILPRVAEPPRSITPH